MERLQKVIAQSGLCSRRKAETLIEEGKVKVNGEIVKTLGTKVSKDDEVLVNNRPLTKSEKVYYVFYKPEGCVSTTNDEHNRTTVLDFIQTQERIYPVGRLDFDTSGVLLLTNDGDFTNMMIHPKSHIEKEYEVTIKGILRKETSRKLEKGIILEGKKTKKSRITKVEANPKKETTKLHITITEGRYHQVKKMFEFFQHDVLKLKRVRFGVVTLDHLSRGQYRLLKPHEHKQLIHYAQKGIKFNEKS